MYYSVHTISRIFLKKGTFCRHSNGVDSKMLMQADYLKHTLYLLTCELVISGDIKKS